nr:unnamed protein product [Callosobruchus analis]
MRLIEEMIQNLIAENLKITTMLEKIYCNDGLDVSNGTDVSDATVLEQETRQDNDTYDKTPRKFQEFKEISRFSMSHHKGGGVGIWAHKSLSVRKLELSDYCIEQHFEICGALWRVNPELKLCMLTLYRSPGGTGDLAIFLHQLNVALDSIFISNVLIILSGDFNLDPQRDRHYYSLLSTLLRSYGMKNYISQPTRQSHILDHFFTNLQTSVIARVIENSLSDHNTIICSTNLSSTLKYLILNSREVSRLTMSIVSSKT